ncbi:conserved hypothetical protein [Ahrensia sp. R2A130]|nr:conserved hypothetical protein [Ahrensia sp. R2A130]
MLRDFLLHVVQDAQMQKQIAPDQPQLSAMMNAKARSEKWWPQNALISIKRIEIVIPR